MSSKMKKPEIDSNKKCPETGKNLHAPTTCDATIEEIRRALTSVNISNISGGMI
ncbi:hypothetical protein HN954_03350 [bacterium]|nr:hypothetical protein [bacterium]MBT6832345.1 hypothetical protein [bacterium]MBT6996440.1 hypothetical protein [bacterium]MBT7772751.1 hypothetical protein [bacterium]